MKYQIGEVVRFSEDTPYNGAFRLGGCLATITDAKQYGNYGDGTLAPGPVYKTAITGDTWVHQDYLVTVNGGMKPAEESDSDSQSTYQLGEVIRFADTLSNREKRLHGKLATLIAVDHGDPETYQTAITADEWFCAGAFESVNGGLPKQEEESVSDSLPVFVPGQKIRVRDDLACWEDTTFGYTGYYVTAAMLALAGQTVTVVDCDGGIIHIAELDNHAWLPDMFIQPFADGEKAVKESVSKSIPLDDIFVAIRRLSDDDYDRFVKAMFRGMSVDKISAGVCTLCDEDFEAVYQELEMESQRRDEKQQRVLAEAIVSAMDAYLQKFGDNHDFYCPGYGDIVTLPMMHDAIVNKFDLTAQ